MQWLCVAPHWQQDANGQATLGGTVRDITRTKLHQNTTNKFTSKKNTILEILSHDLAGSFVMVQQLTGYVRDTLGNYANPQVPEMLNMVLDTSQRSVKLIHDLVNQEFLETTDIPLRRERVDLRERILQALEPAQYLKGSETQHLQVELPPEPVYAEVDIDKYLQVMGNLMLNAYKFTPDGGHITHYGAPHSDRRWHWHSGRVAAALVRAVYSGAPPGPTRRTHHRPRPATLQNHRGAARRRAQRRKRRRPG
jgi:two-component system sensor histidine kinase VicK